MRKPCVTRYVRSGRNFSKFTASLSHCSPLKEIFLLLNFRKLSTCDDISFILILMSPSFFFSLLLLLPHSQTLVEAEEQTEHANLDGCERGREENTLRKRVEKRFEMSRNSRVLPSTFSVFCPLLGCSFFCRGKSWRNRLFVKRWGTFPWQRHFKGSNLRGFKSFHLVNLRYLYKRNWSWSRGWRWRSQRRSSRSCRRPSRPRWPPPRPADSLPRPSRCRAWRTSSSRRPLRGRMSSRSGWSQSRRCWWRRRRPRRGWAWGTPQEPRRSTSCSTKRNESCWQNEKTFSARFDNEI